MSAVGRKRTLGLAWLNPEDVSQRQWAREYLLAKGYSELFKYSDQILPDEPPSHQQMLHAGMAIEDAGGARELFRDMKEAWRQERSRQRKRASGHQACLFILKSSTKANLANMAKDLGTNATALLENLIAKTYKAHQRKLEKQAKQENQPKPLMPEDRSDPEVLMDRTRQTVEKEHSKLPQPNHTSSAQTQEITKHSAEPEKNSFEDSQPESPWGTPDMQTESMEPCVDSSPEDQAKAMCESLATLNHPIQESAPMEPSIGSDSSSEQAMSKRPAKSPSELQH